MRHVYRFSLLKPNATSWEALQAWMKEQNIPYTSNGMHLGNYCLVYIPENVLAEVKAKFPDGEVDADWPILELGDFAQFQAGDKIIIKYMEGEFMDSRNLRGTVHSVSDTEIVILKFRSRTRGYRIQIGDKAEIVKV